MTRQEAIEKWIIPAIKNTWNEDKCKEILKALEQNSKTGQWVYKNGIRYCEFCGASNCTAYATFCSNCGEKMEDKKV